MTVRHFPAGFLWGAATAGHQVEGDNVTSDTWFLEQVSPSVFRDRSGKACNSWELWREDLDIVAGLGLDTYRFSVEWARIEPAEGEFSAAALDHYEAIVDRCLELGIAPVVTFSHFTAPHWFACRGAWFDDAAPALFARYCDHVMERIGDRITYAVTLNEPNLPEVLVSIGLPPFVRDLERATLEAASAAAGVPRYRTANVVLPEEGPMLRTALTAAHRAGKAAIKARRADLPVGLSIAMIDEVAAGVDTTACDRVRADLYGHWLTVARDDDFVGVQNYERRYYDGAGPVEVEGGAVRNQMGSLVAPGSLAGVVRYAYAHAGVPIFVTEHGMSTTDDALRAEFIPPALAGLQQTIAEGVPVLGYTHWSLLDNFEWIFGYGPRFGLCEVDHDTFRRTPKPSAAVYSAIVRANAVAATDLPG
jgi:beta-glucosidase